MTVFGLEKVINTIELGGNHSGNVLVIGAAGSGKKISYIRPNILLEQEKSLLIVDPHKEEFKYTHKEKLEQGYRILNYDLSSETIFEDFRNDLISYGSDKLVIYLNDSKGLSNEKTVKERGEIVQELLKNFFNDEIWSQNLHIILDSYERYPLPNISNFLTTAKGYRIRFSIVLQTINELVHLYDKDLATRIISNFEAFLYTGGLSKQDVEFFSRLAGETIIQMPDENRIKKPFITPEEILTMNRNNALLIVEGEKPKIIEKLSVGESKKINKNDFWEVSTNQLLEVLRDVVVQESNSEASSDDTLLKVKELLNTINSAEDLEKVILALESSIPSKDVWVKWGPKENSVIESVLAQLKIKLESVSM